MNQKEVAELRRRWTPEKTAVSRIYGCFVNSSKQIISDIDESLGIMPKEEAQQYIGFLKKTMSGKLGRNLIDIVFSTQQVVDSEEHRLLTALRSSRLEDSEIRAAFYQRIIDNIDMAGQNYLILIAHDTYDVPAYDKDGSRNEDASDQSFSYIVCAVCPVKERKTELGYFPRENTFHCAAGQMVVAPTMGFLFPAFDDRAANIYSALLYTYKADEVPQEFIGAIFNTEPPFSASEQKAVFHTALAESLEDNCTIEVVQAVLDRLNEKIEVHKENRDPESLFITQQEAADILIDCGATEEQAQTFAKRCTEQMGEAAVLNPANLVDGGRYAIKAGDANVSIPIDQGYQLKTRIIDGRKYILIPAENMEINGLAVIT